MGRLAITAILALLLAGCGGELTCWSTGFAGDINSCVISAECSDGFRGEVKTGGDSSCSSCLGCFSTNGGEDIVLSNRDPAWLYCTPRVGAEDGRDRMAQDLCGDRRVGDNNN